MADGSAVATSATAYALPTSGSLLPSDIGDGVWLRPQLNETSVTTVMDNLQQWGIQNVYVDVFRSGETLFPSEIFPQKPNARDRDWLAFIIEQAHARNIRVHAWLQTLCWAESGPLDFPTTSVMRMHPEWFDLSREGNLFDGASLARFVNPAVPEVKTRLTSLTLELCQYDIDGINLDALHYNYRTDMGYHPVLVEEFEAETGLRVADIERDMATDSDWMRWTLFREDKLTSLVETLGEVCRTQGLKQGRRIVASAIVQPGYDQTRGANFRFQNWADWVRLGLLDVTTPGCFNGDLPGLERQLWEVRSIHMGSDMACIPGFMLNPAATIQRSDNGRMENSSEAHPSLADQRRLLRSAGFQHCIILDYQALLAEKTSPMAPRPNGNKSGFWRLFRPLDQNQQ